MRLLTSAAVSLAIILMPFTLLGSSNGNLRGSLYIEGTSRPVVGATVSCGGKTVESTEEGKYQLSYINSGYQALKISKEGFEPVTDTLIVDYRTIRDYSMRPFGEHEPANIVRLECPTQISAVGQDTTVEIDVYLSTDIELGGFSLGFSYSGDGIEVTSLTAGADLPEGGQAISKLVAEENLALLGWVDFTAKNPIPITEELKALTITVKIPKGVSPLSVDFDSAFVPPAGQFLFSPQKGGQLVPAFRDCGDKDLIIGKPEAVKSD
jgi:hypothetical protein